MDVCRVSIAVALMLAAGAAWADEDVTRKDADACEADVHRLCQIFFPDEKLVAQCLIDRRTDLSPACAQALARPHDEPQGDLPKIDDPKINDPKINDPKIDDPKIDEPKIDEPKVDEPKIDEPHVNEPHVDEPKLNEQK